MTGSDSTGIIQPSLGLAMVDIDNAIEEWALHAGTSRGDAASKAVRLVREVIVVEMDRQARRADPEYAGEKVWEVKGSFMAQLPLRVVAKTPGGAVATALGVWNSASDERTDQAWTADSITSVAQVDRVVIAKGV